MRPVPPIALYMQVAADVLQRHQGWEAAGLRRLDFATVLTEFRRNPGQTEVRIDVLFRIYGEVLATLALQHAILGQVQPLAVRETAQCAKVGGRTCVIMQGTGKLRREDGGERHPQPFRSDDDRRRWPCFEHLANFWLLIAEVHQARWIRRGDDYVNVAHQ